jgi:hypothetical protein
VLDVKEVVNKKRPDGSAVKIAECNVGDASGTIMFTARNKQGASPGASVHTLRVPLLPTLYIHNLLFFLMMDGLCYVPCVPQAHSRFASPPRSGFDEG